jgi:Domain of unknown function (DUF4148)
MFTKTLIAAFVAITAATLASPALALEGDTGQSMKFSSTLSRAEVRAAFIEARNAGLITTGEHTVAVESLQPGGMMLTRAQVVAELREARRIGAIGDGDQPIIPTERQLSLIRMAGERAVAMAVAAR